MSGRNYLMPGGLRPIGFVFVAVGVILAIARYYFNFKPDFLDWKVFALYSSFLGSKMNTFVTNQMIEELAGSFLLAGLFLIAFTREKNESDDLVPYRLKAFICSAYLNLIFLLVAMFTTFGFGFVYALVFFMYWWLVSYIVLLQYFLRKNKQVIKN